MYTNQVTFLMAFHLSYLLTEKYINHNIELSDFTNWKYSNLTLFFFSMWQCYGRLAILLVQVNKCLLKRST